MHRRAFLGGVGSLTLLPSMDSESQTIDVKIFWTEELEENYEDGDDGWGNQPVASHPADVAETYLRTNLAVLARGQRQHYNTPTDFTLEVADEPTQNFNDFLSWSEWVNNNDDATADDANVLLTYDTLDDASIGGKGECASCSDFTSRPIWNDTDTIQSHSDAAIVAYCERLAHIGDEHAQMAFSQANTSSWVLQNVVHELGHCLGLSHDVGDVFTTDSQRFNRWIWVTPMIGSYYLDNDYDIDLHCRDDKPTKQHDDIVAVQVIFGQHAAHYPINTTDGTPVCR